MFDHQKTLLMSMDYSYSFAFKKVCMCFHNNKLLFYA